MFHGVYISVPFCRQKCTFCNFSSGVFAKDQMQRYVDRLCADIRSAHTSAANAGGMFDGNVDSIYLGGGTPTTLAPAQLAQIFRAARESFNVAPRAEITVECAPGTLTPPMLQCLVTCGVDRVSLGVQSFVEKESRAVGRMHTPEIVRHEIEALRAAGIHEISLDLIAGLPHQTLESWEDSLSAVISLDVPHVSVYLLEVDEDSRLGKELIAGGQRYHAHDVPDEEQAAAAYERAMDRLDQAQIRQYEISNFAKPGHESRHNLKYWRREPYFGFGMDASSMLPAGSCSLDAVRFTTPDSLDAYLAWDGTVNAESVDADAAREEKMFLGLRLNAGVVAEDSADTRELIAEGLIERAGDRMRLTPRGRLLSNEVFERFVTVRA